MENLPHFFLVLTAALLVILSGCIGVGSDRDIGDRDRVNKSFSLDFDLKIEVGQSGESVALEAGVRNNGKTVFPENDDIEVIGFIKNESGELRNRFNMYHLGPLQPGEERFPLRYSVYLEPGNYSVKWENSEHGFASAHFQVIKRNGEIRVRDLKISPSK